MNFDVIAPFNEPPGPGGGECKCEGGSCVKVRDCEYGGQWTVTATGSKHVCSSGTHIGGSYDFTLFVDECGATDYKFITITSNANCTGVVEYFLVSLNCYSCADWSCD